MAASRKKAPGRRRASPDQVDEKSGRPVRSDDEVDILQSVGAEEGEGGVLFVDEDRVVKDLGGAVDVDSIRENRRLQEIAERHRNNEKGVPFNTGDPLVIYDTILRSSSPDAIDISVKRLSGTQIQTVIKSRPRSSTDLYEALKVVHGNYAEAEYQVDFLDSSRRTYRGRGRITMPDASHSQGASSMSAPQYPQQPQPPYGWAPQPHPQASQQWQPPWQQQPPPQQQQPPQTAQAQQAAPQTPPAQQAPPAPTYVMPQGPDPMQMMHQMFGIFTEMRNSLQQMQQPQAPPPPQMPPPPPAHADPATMMAWMQDMWGMFQKMQQQQASAAPAPVYQPPPAPVPQPAPQDPLALMGGVIEMFGKMSQIFNAQQGQQQEPRRGPMHRPGVAGYPGRGGGYPPPYAPEEGGYPPAHYRQPPPPREKTASETFRESITVLKTAVDAYNELGSLIPQPQPVHYAPQQAADSEDEDSPVRVVDTGAAKLAFDKKDGTLRAWESGLMNIDKVFNWLGEQREALQKAHAEKSAQEQRRQLPPGYVEVTEGYTPPPGYVTVPVDPQDVPQSDLPPPPANLPPPIDQPAAPTAARTWGMPTFPGEGE